VPRATDPPAPDPAPVPVPPAPAAVTVSGCPGADVPHEATWTQIDPFTPADIDAGVNAVNCHGGRGWVPTFQQAWLNAAAALAPPPPVVVAPNP
jgi:hypothetical protein